MARLDLGAFFLGAVVGAVGVSIATAAAVPPPVIEPPRPRPMFAPPAPAVPTPADGVKRKVMVPPWLWGKRLQREDV